MAAQLTARFPNGMTSLAILLHIEFVTGSYGAAGLVLAATSVGQAIAGPVTSRWMGVWGMRRVLTTTLVICAFAIAGIALIETIVPVYMVLGLIAGLSTPPVQSAVRTIYPKMVNSRQLTPLFSFDASLQEVIWIVAPVVITIVATQVGTVQALLLIVAILIGGGAWFILSPEVGRVRIPRSRRSIGKVLAKPPVLLATVIGFLLIGACAAVEAGVVATFDHGGLEAGIVLAIFSIGSLAGGLSFGHIPIGPWAMARRLAIMAFGLCLTVFSLNIFWLGATLVRRRHRHRTRTGGAVRHDERERQVQRDRRGVRLDRHRAAHRRRDRLGGRRVLDRRCGPDRRLLGGRGLRDRRHRGGRGLRAGLPRPAPPRPQPDPRHRTRRHDHLRTP